MTGRTGGKEKEYASLISGEDQRMSRFINTFLDITRLESGRQEPVKAPVDLKGLLNEALGTMTPLAAGKGISLSLEAPGPLQELLTDRDLLKQCIINLIENGIKYSPPATAVLVKVIDDGRSVTIEVRDRGYGIKKEDRGRVFERFFRGRLPGPGGQEGSGLGLAFVREAVNSMGGGISFESEEGRGTTFTIVLPRHPAPTGRAADRTDT
jgi:two-component system, OmpR family, phosphate regulon sensor histidine kinase PhoR